MAKAKSLVAAMLDAARRAAARPKSRGLPTVAHLAIRITRSMPSCVCSRPSWVSIKQAWT
jgi:hypothetical protein